MALFLFLPARNPAPPPSKAPAAAPVLALKLGLIDLPKCPIKAPRAAPPNAPVAVWRFSRSTSDSTGKQPANTKDMYGLNLIISGYFSLLKSQSLNIQLTGRKDKRSKENDANLEGIHSEGKCLVEGQRELS